MCHFSLLLNKYLVRIVRLLVSFFFQSSEESHTKRVDICKSRETSRCKHKKWMRKVWLRMKNSDTELLPSSLSDFSVCFSAQMEWREKCLDKWWCRSYLNPQMYFEMIWFPCSFSVALKSSWDYKTKRVERENFLVDIDSDI